MEHSSEYRSELVPTWHLMITFLTPRAILVLFRNAESLTCGKHVTLTRHGGSLIWEPLKGLGTNHISLPVFT